MSSSIDTVVDGREADVVVAALRIAAKQWAADAAACSADESRIAAQFERQSADATRMADALEDVL